MVAPEAAQSGPALRGASLLGVFVVAKLAVVAAQGLPLSAAAPVAFFWQDLLAAFALFAADRALARPAAGWTLYGAAVLYTAVNVPVSRILGSPLTSTMLRAARGELADSIAYYATPRVLVWPVLVAAAAVALPLLLARLRARPGDAALAVAAVFVVAGPAAAARVETAGLHRNAIAALAASYLPRVRPHGSDEPWRSSPFLADHGRSKRTAGLDRFRSAAARRNILLVVLESAGARYLAPYGASRDPMPNLTALSRRSIVFENAYAVYPESVEGLVPLLTSRYPALDTEAEAYCGALPPSIAAVAGRRGYRTALFHSGRFGYLGMDTLLAECGFETLEDAGAIGGVRDSSFGIDEASTVRRILAWVDASDRRPFFAVYLPIAGHHPYATIEQGPFPEEDEEGRYLNALYEADSAVGALVSGLAERSLESETLLVVAGDHGEAFGQHPANFGHTLAIYEENVRVPLLLAARGVVEGEIRASGVASLLDVAPTILDLVGIAAPEGYQGTSLLRETRAMALFFTDYSLGLLGLRDGCTKYILELESRRSKIFDLCSDPDERVDLAHRTPERAAFYRARLERWSAAQKARFR